ncbi:hypothetical protein G6F31_021492 [Rhizopus arrhizus]|nr:hypothetical protein G6F31_021492 [Rhizopus arrhizus]
MGYSLDEILGQHHRMFIDPDERESAEYLAFWEKLGQGAYDAGRYRRVRRDGRDVWLQASYNPIFDKRGRPLKVVKPVGGDLQGAGDYRVRIGRNDHPRQ